MQAISAIYKELKVSPEEAIKLIGHVVKCDKKNREFVSRLVGLENDNTIAVFQTKAGKIVKDPLSTLLMMQAVD